MKRKGCGFPFGMDEAVHGRAAVLKNQAWKMAQVKGPISFFQQAVLFVPIIQTGETPKEFNQWKVG